VADLTPEQIEAERAAFEVGIGRFVHNVDLRNDGDGTYIRFETQCAFWGWLAARSTPAAAEWRPIETAPNDGTPILVWLPVKMLGRHVHSATFGKNIKTIGGVFAFDATCAPTHWMPSPPAPDAGSGNNIGRVEAPTS